MDEGTGVYFLWCPQGYTRCIEGPFPIFRGPASPALNPSVYRGDPRDRAGPSVPFCIVSVPLPPARPARERADGHLAARQRAHEVGSPLAPLRRCVAGGLGFAPISRRSGAASSAVLGSAPISRRSGGASLAVLGSAPLSSRAAQALRRRRSSGPLPSRAAQALRRWRSSGPLPSRAATLRCGASHGPRVRSLLARQPSGVARLTVLGPAPFSRG